MSFGGSVSAMISTLKNNARARKTLFDGSAKLASGIRVKKIVSEKKASPELLKEIRTRMKRENRIRSTRILIMTSIFLLILLVILLVI